MKTIKEILLEIAATPASKENPRPESVTVPYADLCFLFSDAEQDAKSTQTLQGIRVVLAGTVSDAAKLDAINELVNGGRQ
jgi:hypothetical protein